MYIYALATALIFTLNCSADDLAVKTNNHTNSFLSSNWGGGMCRGGLHIVSAPLLIPVSLAYGIGTAFENDQESDQETNENTHDYLHIAKQIIVAPMTISVNVIAGAGGCVLETFSGLFDVMSLGNYDLPKYDKSGSYDTRPYFIRLIKDDLQ